MMRNTENGKQVARQDEDIIKGYRVKTVFCVLSEEEKERAKQMIIDAVWGKRSRER